MNVRPKWNGEPVSAVRGSAIVADSGRFPEYWARQFVGQRRDVVRVEYQGTVFYLDDADGAGWQKLLNGGTWTYGHRTIEVERGSFQVLGVELR
jgi:hypothetical protein